MVYELRVKTTDGSIWEIQSPKPLDSWVRDAGNRVCFLAHPQGRTDMSVYIFMANVVFAWEVMPQVGPETNAA